MPEPAASGAADSHPTSELERAAPPSHAPPQITLRSTHGRLDQPNGQVSAAAVQQERAKRAGQPRLPAANVVRLLGRPRARRCASHQDPAHIRKLRGSCHSSKPLQSPPPRARLEECARVAHGRRARTTALPGMVGTESFEAASRLATRARRPFPPDAPTKKNSANRGTEF